MTDRKIISSRKRRPLSKTTEQFILEAQKKHGTKYDYSRTLYNGSHYFIVIVCAEHGAFEQMAKEHLRYGCRKCANASNPLLQKFTTEKFIQKAKSKHGNLYDYSKVEYKGNETPIEIICGKHGSFFQTPHDHYSSEAGCSKCAWESFPGSYTHSRFEKDESLANTSGFLYLVRIINSEGDQCLKIGITKNSVKRRFSQCPHTVITLIIFSGLLYDLFIHEQTLLDMFSNYSYMPEWLAQGRTECFLPKALLELCEEINDRCQVNTTSVTSTPKSSNA